MKNKNWIAGAIAIVVAGGGYYLYTLFKSGKLKFPGQKPSPQPPIMPETPPITPPVTPPITPVTPKPPSPGSTKASNTKVKELQSLIVKRYAQLNMKGYDANDVDGDAGRTADSNTHKAIATLTPQRFANFGLVNSSNVQKYIDGYSKDVATAVKEQDAQKTKKASADKLRQNAKKVVELLDTEKYKAELLDKITPTKHIFDNLSNSYKPLGTTITYNKGYTFRKGDLVARGNGQIMAKSGDYRYPFNPDMLIVRAL
jgi:hypothetical protein